MRLGFGTPECRFCRNVSEGRKKDGTARWRVGGAASYAAAALHRHVTSHRRDANSAATMAGCAMPCIEKMRVAKGLAIGLTVSKARICMKRSAGAHASTARRDASLGEATACSVRIRCQGRSARQQQRCFGY